MGSSTGGAPWSTRWAACHLSALDGASSQQRRKSQRVHGRSTRGLASKLVGIGLLVTIIILFGGFLGCSSPATEEKPAENAPSNPPEMASRDHLADRVAASRQAMAPLPAPEPPPPASDPVIPLPPRAAQLMEGMTLAEVNEKLGQRGMLIGKTGGTETYSWYLGEGMLNVEFSDSKLISKTMKPLTFKVTRSGTPAPRAQQYHPPGRVVKEFTGAAGGPQPAGPQPGTLLYYWKTENRPLCTTCFPPPSGTDDPQEVPAEHYNHKGKVDKQGILHYESATACVN